MANGYTAANAIKAVAKVHSGTNNLVDTYDIQRKAFTLVDFPR
jgi:hypothetical protein